MISKFFRSFMKIWNPGQLKPLCPNSLLRPNDLCNFLTVYFNFAFALCSSPSRFAITENGWFKLKSNPFQKVMFISLNILGTTLWITDLRELLPTTIYSQNPLKYFQYLERLFTSIFQIFALKRFWFNQDEFLNIVNFIQRESSTLPKGTIKIQNKLFSRLICTVFAVMALYEVIWRILLAPPDTWHETIWNRELAAYGRYTFFLANSSSFHIPVQNVSMSDYFFAVIIGLATIQRYITGYYTDLSIMFVVLTVWTATYLFAKNLQADLKVHRPESWTSHSGKSVSADAFDKTPSLVWSDIYRTYQSIRDLCDVVNAAFGNMIMMYIASALLYYSMGMDSILIVSDFRQRIRLLFFICNSTFAFILSADASNRLDTLKIWLSRDLNRSNVPMDQLNIVMHDLQSQVVGIRGGNIFTMTYSLLWHMMTTIITYFIICLQTRQQEQHKIDLEVISPTRLNRTH